MNGPVGAARGSTSDTVVAEVLRAYLDMYWLRPEAALWRTFDALTLMRLGLDRIDLDLGCGDGINSYLLSGGRLPPDVDDFLGTTAVSAATFFTGAVDIYDAPAAGDVAVPAPARRIRYGLDWKQSLLDKARGLGLYDELIQHDANDPLPLAAESIGSVFCNVLYWLDNVDQALKDIGRVLTRDGAATVLVPDAALRDFYVHHRFVVARGWTWMSALDMGRHTHVRHQYSQAEWERRFATAGLRVRDHEAYLSSRVIEIHEVGLRPLSPVLIKMAGLLSPADRAQVKSEWVDYVMALALPMITSGWLEAPELTTTFHAFVLERA
jgi:SAM-dependent methyltransferase